jgi:nitrate/nitrite-specific signal transduction histidine kinase
MNIIKKLDLRGRLFAIFTMVFLLTLGVLAVFLRGAARAVELNAKADVIFSDVREFLALKQSLSAMELAQNRYEVSTDLADESAFYAQLWRMNDQIFLLSDSDDPQLIAALDEIQTSLNNYRGLFEEIQNAVIAEDWETVTVKDDAIYVFLPELFDKLDQFVTQNEQQLTDINAEIDDYQTTVVISALFGLTIFTVLSFLALWMIHRQVNRPLSILNTAVRQLENDQFKPAPVEKLAERGDEIGVIAASLLATAGELAGRQAALQAEAEQVKAKIK